jgi:hypothetical protein
MPTEDALLFVDANRYLELYRTVTGRHLLAPLSDRWWAGNCSADPPRESIGPTRTRPENLGNRAAANYRFLNGSAASAVCPDRSPRLGALPDQAALEFSQRAKHMKNKPAQRSRRVEGFSQAAKTDAPHPQRGAPGEAGRRNSRMTTSRSPRRCWPIPTSA